MPSWKNRIVESGMIAPSAIEGHPENWRTHPQHQREALTGALRELGWIQQVVLNKRTGYLIDGHLRVALALEAKESEIPVLYVDLSEDEERLALLTLDPIAALAETNREALTTLLHEVQSGEAGLQAMLSELAERQGIVPQDGLDIGGDAPEDFPEYGEDISTDYCCPKCGYTWSGKPQ